jgi:imidazole glycerol-phosphate synthase subunit HisH
VIVIVDEVGTNIASLQFACARLGKETIMSSNPKEIMAASHVILPGVSTAGRAMDQLTRKGLVETIQHLKQPVLGICSGMQILFDWSEEGDVKGLGLFSQKVNKLRTGAKHYLPHMGWNTLTIEELNCPLLKNIPDQSYVYFVHSFATGMGKYTKASCEHGVKFSAIVSKNNFYGTQFHPRDLEKWVQRY